MVFFLQFGEQWSHHWSCLKLKNRGLVFHIVWKHSWFARVRKSTIVSLHGKIIFGGKIDLSNIQSESEHKTARGLWKDILTVFAQGTWGKSGEQQWSYVVTWHHFHHDDSVPFLNILSDMGRMPTMRSDSISIASGEWPTPRKATEASKPTYSCITSWPPGCWNELIETWVKAPSWKHSIFLCSVRENNSDKNYPGSSSTRKNLISPAKLRVNLQPFQFPLTSRKKSCTS